MKDLREFALETKDDKVAFLPGEVIRGELYLCLEEPVEIRCIKVFLIGEGEGAWLRQCLPSPTSSRKNTKETMKKQHLVSIGLIVFGYKEEDKTQTEVHEHGRYVYEFEFDLPDNLPCTFRSPSDKDLGYARYYLKAILSRPKKHDKEIRQKIVINELLDPERPELAFKPGKYDEKNVKSACIPSGSLSLESYLNQSFYIQGDKILINTLAENKSSKIMKELYAVLVRRVHCKSRYGTTTYVTEETRISGARIASQDKLEWKEHPLAVPPVGPTITGNVDIRVDYLVRVGMHEDMGSELHLDLPVVIGTVRTITEHEQLKEQEELISQVKIRDTNREKYGLKLIKAKDRNKYREALRSNKETRDSQERINIAPDDLYDFDASFDDDKYAKSYDANLHKNESKNDRLYRSRSVPIPKGGRDTLGKGVSPRAGYIRRNSRGDKSPRDTLTPRSSSAYNERDAGGRLSNRSDRGKSPTSKAIEKQRRTPTSTTPTNDERQKSGNMSNLRRRPLSRSQEAISKEKDNYGGSKNGSRRTSFGGSERELNNNEVDFMGSKGQLGESAIPISDSFGSNEQQSRSSLKGSRRIDPRRSSGSNQTGSRINLKKIYYQESDSRKNLSKSDGSLDKDKDDMENNKLQNKNKEKDRSAERLSEEQAAKERKYTEPTSILKRSKDTLQSSANNKMQEKQQKSSSKTPVSNRSIDIDDEIIPDVELTHESVDDSFDAISSQFDQNEDQIKQQLKMKLDSFDGPNKGKQNDNNKAKGNLNKGGPNVAKPGDKRDLIKTPAVQKDLNKNAGVKTSEKLSNLGKRIEGKKDVGSKAGGQKDLDKKPDSRKGLDKRGIGQKDSKNRTDSRSDSGSRLDGRRGDSDKRLDSRRDSDSRQSGQRDSDKITDSTGDSDSRPNCQRDLDRRNDCRRDSDIRQGAQRDSENVDGSRRDSNSRPSDQRDSDKRTDSRRDSDGRLDGKRDTDKRLDSRRDSGSRPSGQRGLEDRDDSRRDSDRRPSGQRDSDKRIDSRRDSDSRPDGQRDSNKRTDSRRDPDSRLSGQRDSDKKTDSRSDLDIRPGAQRDSDKKTDSRRDLDIRPGAQRDSDNRDGSRRDSESRPDGQRDSDQKTDSRRDSDSRPSGRRDSEKRTDSRRDLDSRPGAQRDSNNRDGSRRDSDSRPGAQRDSDNRAGSPNDLNNRPYVQRDSDQRLDSKIGPDSLPSDESKEDKKFDTSTDLNTSNSSQKDLDRSSNSQKDLNMSRGSHKDLDKNTSYSKDLNKSSGSQKDYIGQDDKTEEKDSNIFKKGLGNIKDGIRSLFKSDDKTKSNTDEKPSDANVSFKDESDADNSFDTDGNRRKSVPEGIYRKTLSQNELNNTGKDKDPLNRSRGKLNEKQPSGSKQEQQKDKTSRSGNKKGDLNNKDKNRPDENSKNKIINDQIQRDEKSQLGDKGKAISDKTEKEGNAMTDNSKTEDGNSVDKNTSNVQHYEGKKDQQTEKEEPSYKSSADNKKVQLYDDQSDVKNYELKENSNLVPSKTMGGRGKELPGYQVEDFYYDDNSGKWQSETKQKTTPDYQQKKQSEEDSKNRNEDEEDQVNQQITTGDKQNIKQRPDITTGDKKNMKRRPDKKFNDLTKKNEKETIEIQDIYISDVSQEDFFDALKSPLKDEQKKTQTKSKRTPVSYEKPAVQGTKKVGNNSIDDEQFLREFEKLEKEFKDESKEILLDEKNESVGEGTFEHALMSPIREGTFEHALMSPIREEESEETESPRKIEGIKKRKFTEKLRPRNKDKINNNTKDNKITSDEGDSSFIEKDSFRDDSRVNESFDDDLIDKSLDVTIEELKDKDKNDTSKSKNENDNDLEVPKDEDDSRRSKSPWQAVERFGKWLLGVKPVEGEDKNEKVEKENIDKDKTRKSSLQEKEKKTNTKEQKQGSPTKGKGTSPSKTNVKKHLQPEKKSPTKTSHSPNRSISKAQQAKNDEANNKSKQAVKDKAQKSKKQSEDDSDSPRTYTIDDSEKKAISKAQQLKNDEARSKSKQAKLGGTYVVEDNKQQAGTSDDSQSTFTYDESEEDRQYFHDINPKTKNQQSKNLNLTPAKQQKSPKTAPRNGEKKPSPSLKKKSPAKILEKGSRSPSTKAKTSKSPTIVKKVKPTDKNKVSGKTRLSSTESSPSHEPLLSDDSLEQEERNQVKGRIPPVKTTKDIPSSPKKTFIKKSPQRQRKDLLKSGSTGSINKTPYDSLTSSPSKTASTDSLKYKPTGVSYSPKHQPAVSSPLTKQKSQGVSASPNRSLTSYDSIHKIPTAVQQQASVSSEETFYSASDYEDDDTNFAQMHDSFKQSNDERQNQHLITDAVDADAHQRYKDSRDQIEDYDGRRGYNDNDNRGQMNDGRRINNSNDNRGEMDDERRINNSNDNIGQMNDGRIGENANDNRRRQIDDGETDFGYENISDEDGENEFRDRDQRESYLNQENNLEENNNVRPFAEDDEGYGTINRKTSKSKEERKDHPYRTYAPSPPEQRKDGRSRAPKSNKEKSTSQKNDSDTTDDSTKKERQGRSTPSWRESLRKNEAGASPKVKRPAWNDSVKTIDVSADRSSQRKPSRDRSSDTSSPSVSRTKPSRDRSSETSSPSVSRTNSIRRSKERINSLSKSSPNVTRKVSGKGSVERLQDNKVTRSPSLNRKLKPTSKDRLSPSSSSKRNPTDSKRGFGKQNTKTKLKSAEGSNEKTQFTNKDKDLENELESENEEELMRSKEEFNKETDWKQGKGGPRQNAGPLKSEDFMKQSGTQNENESKDTEENNQRLDENDEVFYEPVSHLRDDLQLPPTPPTRQNKTKGLTSKYPLTKEERLPNENKMGITNDEKTKGYGRPSSPNKNDSHHSRSNSIEREYNQHSRSRSPNKENQSGSQRTLTPNNEDYYDQHSYTDKYEYHKDRNRSKSPIKDKPYDARGSQRQISNDNVTSMSPKNKRVDSGRSTSPSKQTDSRVPQFQQNQRSESTSKNNISSPSPTNHGQSTDGKNYMIPSKIPETRDDKRSSPSEETGYQDNNRSGSPTKENQYQDNKQQPTFSNVPQYKSASPRSDKNYSKSKSGSRDNMTQSKEQQDRPRSPVNDNFPNKDRSRSPIKHGQSTDGNKYMVPSKIPETRDDKRSSSPSKQTDSRVPQYQHNQRAESTSKNNISSPSPTKHGQSTDGKNYMIPSKIPETRDNKRPSSPSKETGNRDNNRSGSPTKENQYEDNNQRITPSNVPQYKSTSPRSDKNYSKSKSDSRDNMTQSREKQDRPRSPVNDKFPNKDRSRSPIKHGQSTDGNNYMIPSKIPQGRDGKRPSSPSKKAGYQDYNRSRSPSKENQYQDNKQLTASKITETTDGQSPVSPIKARGYRDNGRSTSQSKENQILDDQRNLTQSKVPKYKSTSPRNEKELATKERSRSLTKEKQAADGRKHSTPSKIPESKDRPRSTSSNNNRAVYSDNDRTRSEVPELQYQDRQKNIVPSNQDVSRNSRSSPSKVNKSSSGTQKVISPRKERGYKNDNDNQLKDNQSKEFPTEHGYYPDGENRNKKPLKHNDVFEYQTKELEFTDDRQTIYPHKKSQNYDRQRSKSPSKQNYRDDDEEISMPQNIPPPYDNNNSSHRNKSVYKDDPKSQSKDGAGKADGPKSQSKDGAGKADGNYYNNSKSTIEQSPIGYEQKYKYGPISNEDERRISVVSATFDYPQYKDIPSTSQDYQRRHDQRNKKLANEIDNIQETDYYYKGENLNPKQGEIDNTRPTKQDYSPTQHIDNDSSIDTLSEDDIIKHTRNNKQSKTEKSREIYPGVYVKPSDNELQSPYPYQHMKNNLLKETLAEVTDEELSEKSSVRSDPDSTPLRLPITPQIESQAKENAVILKSIKSPRTVGKNENAIVLSVDNNRDNEDGKILSSQHHRGVNDRRSPYEIKPYSPHDYKEQTQDDDSYQPTPRPESNTSYTRSRTSSRDEVEPVKKSYVDSSKEYERKQPRSRSSGGYHSDDKTRSRESISKRTYSDGSYTTSQTKSNESLSRQYTGKDPGNIHVDSRGPILPYVGYIEQKDELRRHDDDVAGSNDDLQRGLRLPPTPPEQKNDTGVIEMKLKPIKQNEDNSGKSLVLPSAPSTSTKQAHEKSIFYEIPFPKSTTRNYKKCQTENKSTDGIRARSISPKSLSKHEKMVYRTRSLSPNKDGHLIKSRAVKPASFQQPAQYPRHTCGNYNPSTQAKNKANKSTYQPRKKSNQSSPAHSYVELGLARPTSQQKMNESYDIQDGRIRDQKVYDERVLVGGGLSFNKTSPKHQHIPPSSSVRSSNVTAKDTGKTKCKRHAIDKCGVCRGPTYTDQPDGLLVGYHNTKDEISPHPTLTDEELQWEQKIKAYINKNKTDLSSATETSKPRKTSKPKDQNDGEIVLGVTKQEEYQNKPSYSREKTSANREALKLFKRSKSDRRYFENKGDSKEKQIPPKSVVRPLEKSQKSPFEGDNVQNTSHSAPRLYYEDYKQKQQPQPINLPKPQNKTNKSLSRSMDESFDSFEYHEQSLGIVDDKGNAKRNSQLLQMSQEERDELMEEERQRQRRLKQRKNQALMKELEEAKLYRTSSCPAALGTREGLLELSDTAYPDISGSESGTEYATDEENLSEEQSDDTDGGLIGRYISEGQGVNSDSIGSRITYKKSKSTALQKESAYNYEEEIIDTYKLEEKEYTSLAKNQTRSFVPIKNEKDKIKNKESNVATTAIPVKRSVRIKVNKSKTHVPEYSNKDIDYYYE